MLHQGTFMWFTARQEYIYAGWLLKLGGGHSLLGRKSWNRRWVTIQGGNLVYYAAQEGQAMGSIDVQRATDIIEA